jgi:hypothetical protein
MPLIRAPQNSLASSDPTQLAVANLLEAAQTGAQGSTMAARHNSSSRTGIKSLLPACRPRLPSITRADFSGQVSSFMSLDQVNAYPQGLQVRLQITAIAHMPNNSP